jgi:glycosyltransferase involved in cell wall biosynthesis
MIKNKISVIMLTQNNESTMPAVLTQLDKIADEIIIVDGGSRDNTVKILELNSKTTIYYRKFDGNFAEQRNFGIEKASGKWLITLDTDELFCDLSVKLIPWLIKLPFISYFKFPRAWLVIQDNCISFITNKPYYPDYQLRLFRNKKKFRYQINGHNTHETFPKKGRGLGMKLFFLKILHFDFIINNRARREKKVERYISLDPLKTNIHNRYLWEDRDVVVDPCIKNVPEYSKAMYS